MPRNSDDPPKCYDAFLAQDSAVPSATAVQAMTTDPRERARAHIRRQNGSSLNSTVFF